MCMADNNKLFNAPFFIYYQAPSVTIRSIMNPASNPTKYLTSSHNENCKVSAKIDIIYLASFIIPKRSDNGNKL